jgi:hypothetical protein
MNNKFKFLVHSLPLHNAPLFLVSKSQQIVPLFMMPEGSLTLKSLKAFLALRDKYLISNQSHELHYGQTLPVTRVLLWRNTSLLCSCCTTVTINSSGTRIVIDYT